MSRRIVQISAMSAVDRHPDGLFALDNTGVVWVMWSPSGGDDRVFEWQRLAELPSVPDTPDSLAERGGQS